MGLAWDLHMHAGPMQTRCKHDAREDVSTAPTGFRALGTPVDCVSSSWLSRRGCSFSRLSSGVDIGTKSASQQVNGSFY